MIPNLYRYPDPAQLAAALCERISTCLHNALSRGASASLVLPGGRTPVALMQRLSHVPLDWRRVNVTLTDERLVAPGDARGNARLVRDHLLRHEAANARFVELDQGEHDPQRAVALADRALAAIPRPYDVVLLGMGEDGHTASLFPGSPLLGPASNGAHPMCAHVDTPAAPNVPLPRLTLLPATLTDARLLLVAITGEPKLRRIEQARRGGPLAELPIRLALNHSKVPCHVYWSP